MCRWRDEEGVSRSRNEIGGEAGPNILGNHFGRAGFGVGDRRIAALAETWGFIWVEDDPTTRALRHALMELLTPEESSATCQAGRLFVHFQHGGTQLGRHGVWPFGAGECHKKARAFGKMERRSANSFSRCRNG